MNWLLNFLEKHDRCLTLRDKGGDIYLKRYYLYRKEKTNQFEEEKTSYSFNVYLHQFFKSDMDDLHDHPWNFVSLVLKGGYFEELMDKNNPDDMHVTYTPPLHFNVKKAEDYHRVIVPDKPCWTLFFRGKTRRKWGFNVNGKWIDAQKYLKERT